jgi:hypothetical protein
VSEWLGRRSLRPIAVHAVAVVAIVGTRGYVVAVAATLLLTTGIGVANAAVFRIHEGRVRAAAERPIPVGDANVFQ